MFGWGYRRERLRGVIGRYSTKRAFAAGGVGGSLDDWELNMEDISQDQHSFFTKYFSFLYEPMVAIVQRWKVKCLELMPTFPAMFVTSQYCSAAHFDLDFSWSLCFWYNKRTPVTRWRYMGRLLPAKSYESRKTVANQSGGHFYSPSIRSAFKLDSPCSAIVFHGSRLCHGTTLYSSEQKVKSHRQQFLNLHFLLWFCFGLVSLPGVLGP